MEQQHRHSIIETADLTSEEAVARGRDPDVEGARANTVRFAAGCGSHPIPDIAAKGEPKARAGASDIGGAADEGATSDKILSADKVASDARAGAQDADVPKVSRKVRRRRRRTRPRSKTIAMKRLTREELRRGALMYPPVDIPRPTTRSECMVEQRPCPWVACKHHLYLDVNPVTGSIKINFPDLEPWELAETCALDVAERGGITLEEVGEIMNLTRERIRQVEVRGLQQLRASSPAPEELGTMPIDE